MVWLTGSPTRIVHVDVTLTRSKVKVMLTGLLKLQNCRKLHFSTSISSAILEWSLKLMVDHDSRDLVYSLSEPDFLICFSKSEFNLCGMSILRKFQTAIFRYCWRLQSHGPARWQSYMFTHTDGLLDNSRIRQLADCQLADWTTRGLAISRTGQLAD